MEESKTTRWAFTAYEEQWPLFESMPPLIAEWGWQQEVCPKTQREHYQGFIRTQRQMRFSQIRKLLPGVHIEAAKNWDALVNYCRKLDTAVEGTQVHEVTQNVSMSMAKALIKVALNRDRGAVHKRRIDAALNLKELREAYAYEYDVAVGELLRQDENLVGIYSQPQYERAYTKWRRVWVEKADALEAKESEKTDRQTDKTADREETAISRRSSVCV